MLAAHIAEYAAAAAVDVEVGGPWGDVSARRRYAGEILIDAGNDL